MKTIYQAKQWILSLLLNNGAKTIINGGIYKDKRPSGSIKEDIVINGVTMNATFLQDAVLNVNIYVPFKTVKIENTNQLQPDHERIEELAILLYPLLHEQYTNDFNLTIVSNRSFEELAEKANYINFTINLKAFN